MSKWISTSGNLSVLNHSKCKTNSSSSIQCVFKDPKRVYNTSAMDIQSQDCKRGFHYTCHCLGLTLDLAVKAFSPNCSLPYLKLIIHCSLPYLKSIIQRLTMHCGLWTLSKSVRIKCTCSLQPTKGKIFVSHDSSKNSAELCVRIMVIVCKPFIAIHFTIHPCVIREQSPQWIIYFPFYIPQFWQFRPSHNHSTCMEIVHKSVLHINSTDVQFAAYTPLPSSRITSYVKTMAVSHSRERQFEPVIGQFVFIFLLDHPVSIGVHFAQRPHVAVVVETTFTWKWEVLVIICRKIKLFCHVSC